jgi:hypothetical protein
MIHKNTHIMKAYRFFGNSIEKSSDVKRVWSEAILGWVINQRVFSGAQKCAEKTSVDL